MYCAALQAELSFTLKSDLADGLARGADSAFLAGAKPRGISARADLEVTKAASVLETVRAVVTNLREKQEAPEFRQPGWILHPRTLDDLTRSPVGDTLDKYRLLRLDRADGGTLAGFPFVTSPGTVEAEPPPTRVYFAADWSDAFVGIGERPVIVDTPAAPEVSGATVIRASMTADFILRRRMASHGPTLRDGVDDAEVVKKRCPQGSRRIARHARREDGRASLAGP